MAEQPIYVNKSQSLAYDASKWNAQDANQIKEYLQYLENKVNYKSLVCTLKHSTNYTTTNPAINVLYNTIGGTFICTRTAAGQYYLNNGQSIFDVNYTAAKTVVFINGNTNYNYPTVFSYQIVGEFVQIYKSIVDPGQPVLQDGIDISIEIRIYK
jgi:hypothetical protein